MEKYLILGAVLLGAIALVVHKRMAPDASEYPVVHKVGEDSYAIQPPAPRLMYDKDGKLVQVEIAHEGYIWLFDVLDLQHVRSGTSTR